MIPTYPIAILVRENAFERCEFEEVPVCLAVKALKAHAPPPQQKTLGTSPCCTDWLVLNSMLRLCSSVMGPEEGMNGAPLLAEVHVVHGVGSQTFPTRHRK